MGWWDCSLEKWENMRGWLGSNWGKLGCSSATSGCSLDWSGYSRDSSDYTEGTRGCSQVSWAMPHQVLG